MVDFAQVVPFFEWGLLVLAIILIANFVSKVFRAFQKFLRRESRFLDDYRNEKLPEQEDEGAFFYAAEILHLLVFTIVFLVAYEIVLYLLSGQTFTSTIYDATLGVYTVPLVAGIAGYYVLKMLPYWLKQGGFWKVAGEE